MKNFENYNLSCGKRMARSVERGVGVVRRTGIRTPAWDRVPERKTRKKIRCRILLGIVCKIWFATRFLLATPMKHIVQFLEIITSGTT